MEYFPEGIHIRKGSNHVVRGVTSAAICEDAITTDRKAKTGHTIAGCTLTGHTTPGPGHTCYGLDGNPDRCGIDKAIQVNGGGAAITGNTLDTIGQPVAVVAGTHVISDNHTAGDPTDRNVCQAYTIAGQATTTLTGNTIDHCKFGIRVVDDAAVEANDNIITNGYVSAFQVTGSGTSPLLKGAGNRLGNDGSSTESECQRGALVVRDNPNARIDFGGGDFAGAPSSGASRAGATPSARAA